MYIDCKWFKHEYDLSRKPASDFFDNLTEDEKAEIKYLTLDDEFRISEYYEENDDAAFKALRAGVESITGIRELGISFEVDYCTDRSLGAQTSRHNAVLRYISVWYRGYHNWYYA
jgi:hypothetical protein